MDREFLDLEGHAPLPHCFLKEKPPVEGTPSVDGDSHVGDLPSREDVVKVLMGENQCFRDDFLILNPSVGIRRSVDEYLTAVRGRDQLGVGE